MKRGPQESEREMETITLTRTGDKPVQFQGELVAEIADALTGSAQLTAVAPSDARCMNGTIAAVIISTTRRGRTGSILVNQVDSVESCFVGTGTSEIIDLPSRVNLAAPKCPQQYRDNRVFAAQRYPANEIIAQEQEKSAILHPDRERYRSF